ncbi:unnamed protein product [Schistocephalus solidus]|uniref:NAD(P)-bd_dom domain-containing protein n=1 Tax=Schistocephalus solidus TaxID=70667 RepID=A0A183TH74_SCHSO|nr:unnamed protein product [Schistocephalus solidus]
MARVRLHSHHRLTTRKTDGSVKDKTVFRADVHEEKTIAVVVAGAMTTEKSFNVMLSSLTRTSKSSSPISLSAFSTVVLPRRPPPVTTGGLNRVRVSGVVCASTPDNPWSNRPERRTALVARELARYKVDIAALRGTRFSEQGQLEDVGAATPSSGAAGKRQSDVTLVFPSPYGTTAWDVCLSATGHQ